MSEQKEGKGRLVVVLAGEAVHGIQSIEALPVGKVKGHP